MWSQRLCCPRHPAPSLILHGLYGLQWKSLLVQIKLHCLLLCTHLTLLFSDYGLLRRLVSLHLKHLPVIILNELLSDRNAQARWWNMVLQCWVGSCTSCWLNLLSIAVYVHLDRLISVPSFGLDFNLAALFLELNWNQLTKADLTTTLFSTMLLPLVLTRFPFSEEPLTSLYICCRRGNVELKIW